MYRVPHAKEGRGDVDLNIYGMQGVPEEAKVAKAQEVANGNLLITFTLFICIYI